MGSTFEAGTPHVLRVAVFEATSLKTATVLPAGDMSSRSPTVCWSCTYIFSKMLRTGWVFFEVRVFSLFFGASSDRMT